MPSQPTITISTAEIDTESKFTNLLEIIIGIFDFRLEANLVYYI